MFKNRPNLILFIKRLLYTLFIIFVFQIGGRITLPGLNNNVDMFADNNALQLLNISLGGLVGHFGLFTLGVGPSVTANIIVQLYNANKKNSSDTYRQDKQKENQYVRLLVLIFGLFQGFMIINSVNALRERVSAPLLVDNLTTQMLMVAILSIGGLIVSYLGERINTKGVGNGVSMLIISTIIINAGQYVYDAILYVLNTGDWITYAAIFGITLVLLFIVTMLNVSEVKIPLRSFRYREKEFDHFFPIRFLSASIMPIIITNMLLGFVRTLFPYQLEVQEFVSPTNLSGLVLSMVLIMIFTFVYNHLQLKPERMVEQLHKSDLYISDLRITEQEKYLKKTVNKVSLLGGSILIMLSILPTVIHSMYAPFPLMNATSLIIFVGGCLTLFQHARAFRERDRLQ